ncbi:glycosyltransferase [Mycobacterium camsae]|uniref:glycosyltransferase n=1 Tax=Mycobacterium gordonae TaxID=1778 RepID=UPI00197D522F|nr:nucleotide disphospho-sugar-binding domain-containing protein [Mycobacterium gordonae]
MTNAVAAALDTETTAAVVKILFVTVDGGGNISPQLAVARVLRSRGSRIHFLGHPGIRDRVEAAGFSFESLPTRTDFDPTRQRSLLRMASDIAKVQIDRRIGAAVVAAACRYGADVVVIDMLLTATIDEVVAAHMATVVFVHCFYRQVQNKAGGPLGWLMRARGVDPLGAERSGALHIVTARRDLDPIHGTPPVHHVGVVWQGVPTESTVLEVPRILVSLSTLGIAGQRSMLRRILHAVAPLPVHATVTVGPAIDASGLRVPANASIHDWLDHDEVLPTTAMVVGHGGHSTTMRALSFGVPVVVLPANPLIDQKMVGAALHQVGAGILLSKHARTRRIRTAIRAVLEDPRYRDAADRLGRQIRQRDGAQTAADEILQFARASRL